MRTIRLIHRQALLAAIILTILIPSGKTRVIAQQPTPVGLNKTLYFWDLGLSLKVPDTWTDAQYSVSQMITYATPPGSADNNVVKQPTVAVRVMRSSTVLQLPKDAPLSAIAQALSAGTNVSITAKKSVSVASLDAYYISLDYQPDPNSNTGELLGNTFVYRALDGRLGALLLISPRADWPEFIVLSGQIANTAALLKPSDFPVPTISQQAGSQLTAYRPGAIRFILPDNWIAKSAGTNGMIFHDRNVPEYQDQSGYANGPQLVLSAAAMPAKTTLHDAVTQIVQPSADAVTSDITVGGQPGVQIVFTDPRTEQIETIVGFTSSDQQTLNLFRWTVPGMLVDVLRPTFNAILASVQYAAVPTATSTVMPTVAATAAPTDSNSATLAR